MKKFLKLYNEFKGVKLSLSQRNEILEIRNQYTHIPLKWALEKARSLFPSVKWLYKDEYIDKLWKRRER
ncbi:MAG: hypothetical protein J7K23_01715 [Thermoproteales archaeon]|nr:hypothetical protein [Thermoproteales archaeon]